MLDKFANIVILMGRISHVDKTKIVARNGRPSASGGAGIIGKHPFSILAYFMLYNQSRGRIELRMCWYCGMPVSDPEPIGRSSRCLSCGKDLRSCKNCRFFLPGGRGDCRESSAEEQTDKERANFCDWFSLDSKFRGESAGESKEIEKAKASKAAFDNLFN